MSKHVHSSDARKAAIVAALKAKSGGSKVTLLREVAPNTFTGSCLGKLPGAKKFEQLGEYTVALGAESEPHERVQDVTPYHTTHKSAKCNVVGPRGERVTHGALVSGPIVKRSAAANFAGRVELVGNEVDDALAAIELALEEKRKAHEAVKHQGFTERDFGIPQLEALEAKLEGAQS